MTDKRRPGQISNPGVNKRPKTKLGARNRKEISKTESLSSLPPSKPITISFGEPQSPTLQEPARSTPRAERAVSPRGQPATTDRAKRAASNSGTPGPNQTLTYTSPPRT